MQWRKRPVIYEIHTWAWLADLRARYGHEFGLGDVPPQEWDALGALRMDAVWFMGVWQRSPLGVEISNANRALQIEFQRALADYTPQDNIGSAYCVRAYAVDERLGGAEGLARARRELAKRGMRLILDFVPNHVAPDHAWVARHPEFFVRGTRADLEQAPESFFERDEIIFANGRDPNFPAWRDVLQLNAFHAGARAAAIETVNTLAAQCDGLRCDVAMLLLNRVFAATWRARAGDMPETEYWGDLIAAVKKNFPDLLFIAEAYWDTEAELIANGFDYCYDKKLYDRLAHATGNAVLHQIRAAHAYQDHLVRFIENHDEPRAAKTFAPLQQRAAALATATLPGAKIFYEGQLDGRQIKTPVFLARRAAEAKEYELESFYRALLKALHADLFRVGEWSLCERSGWSDNTSFENIVAWTWRSGNERALIVVNYSARRAQAMIQLTWDDLRGQIWRLSDAMNGDVFLRDGNQLCESGLFVDLAAWRFHFLMFE